MFLYPFYLFSFQQNNIIHINQLIDKFRLLTCLQRQIYQAGFRIRPKREVNTVAYFRHASGMVRTSDPTIMSQMLLMRNSPNPKPFRTPCLREWPQLVQSSLELLLRWESFVMFFQLANKKVRKGLDQLKLYSSKIATGAMCLPLLLSQWLNIPLCAHLP